MNRYQRRHQAPVLDTLSDEVRLGTYSSRSIRKARMRASLNELSSIVKFVLDHPHPVERIRYSHKLKTRKINDQYIFGRAFPKDFAELGVEASFPPLDLPAEIVWATSYFLAYSSELNGFVEQSMRFSDSYLSDDLEVAKQVLASIEATYGQSLWLIKNKVALLQATDGLDAQKQYSATIRNAFGNQSLVPVLAHYISVRNEPSVTPTRFYSEFNSFLRSNNVEEESISAFLKYHITPYPVADPSHLLDILEWTNTGSVIDYYESFVYCLQCAGMNEYSYAESQVCNSLDMLCQRIRDPRVRMVLALAGGSYEVPEPTESALLLADLSVSSEASHYRHQLKTHPVDKGDLFTDLFRAQELINENDAPNISTKFTQRFVSFLKKDSSSGDTNAALTKEAINFYGSSWAFTLLSLLEEETESTPLPLRGGHSHFAAVAVPTLHPSIAIRMPSCAQQKRYTTLVVEHLGSRPSTLYASYISAIMGDEDIEAFSIKNPRREQRSI